LNDEPLNTRTSYDAIAAKYAEKFRDEMDHEPFDRDCLDADGSWGGIAAFYSVVHIPREQIVAALSEMRRVLEPGGVLLVTFHIGDETVHVDEWMDIRVNVVLLPPTRADGSLAQGRRVRARNDARAGARSGRRSGDEASLHFCEEELVDSRSRDLTPRPCTFRRRSNPRLAGRRPGALKRDRAMVHPSGCLVRACAA
jgi:SAM-dependent methyltransferase